LCIAPFLNIFPSIILLEDRQSIQDKGIDTIRSHAIDFITTRSAPAIPNNDWKQTPMKGYPIFIAPHPTATCCRRCLLKWHRSVKGPMILCICKTICLCFGNQRGKTVHKNIAIKIRPKDLSPFDTSDDYMVQGTYRIYLTWRGMHPPSNALAAIESIISLASPLFPDRLQANPERFCAMNIA
jgi:hypothetical protein